MFFDIRYLIIALPALLLAFYAQWKVNSAYNKTAACPTGGA